MFMTTQTVSVATLLGIFLLPVNMLIAAQGWNWTFIIFCVLPMSLKLLTRWHLSKSKKRTQFFLTWTITSLFYLLGVFEFEVVPFLEILFSENFILVCWFGLACLFAHFTRRHSTPSAIASELRNDELKNDCFKNEWSRCELCSLKQPPRSSHCKLCGFCIPRKDHHCLWLDVCIGSQNHHFFLGCLISLVIACCYYANLTLTTVCHPTLVNGLFLFPDDCSDVFGEIHISICFVSALYALLIAATALLKFVQQCWFICQSSAFCGSKYGHSEFHNKGIFYNCAEFWYRC